MSLDLQLSEDLAVSDQAIFAHDGMIYVFGGYEPSVTDIERLDTVGSD